MDEWGVRNTKWLVVSNSRGSGRTALYFKYGRCICFGRRRVFEPQKVIGIGEIFVVIFFFFVLHTGEVVQS